MNKKHTGPIVFVVCDGLGIAKKNSGNAVEEAGMSFLHKLMQEYPSWNLAAHGEWVGLLPGFIGNSEVGHLTLGSGQVIKSSIARFHDLIKSNNLASQGHNEILKTFASTNKKLHIIGLLSDGGVHSHELHLHSMLENAAQNGIKNIVIHPILDGRDVSPKSAALYLKRLEKKIFSIGSSNIGSIQGRFYAMDRNHNWDRTAQSYAMLCSSVASPFKTWQQALDTHYTTGKSDEFITPTLLDTQWAMDNGDAIIFVNVRPDRALQLTKIFLDKKIQTNNNAPTRDFAFVMTGSRYAKELNNPVILEPMLIKNTILDVIADQAPDLPIFLVAETEKFAHVTYFFKGMRNEQFKQEKRFIIPSLRAENYIQHPEMMAKQITTQIEELLTKANNAFCVVNYANLDMVGHSGDFKATAKACLVVDAQLKKLYHLVVEKMHGTLVITADHGNAEEMLDANGEVKTAHTTNPAPFVIIAENLKKPTAAPPHDLHTTHGIAHVAPTLLMHMGIEKPAVMVNALDYTNALQK